MRFWYVRHTYDWYEKHPDIIDLPLSSPKRENDKVWGSIKASDKIVYFSYNPPKGIVGLFNVESNGERKRFGDASAPASWYYRISPLFLSIENGKPREFSAKNDIGLSMPPHQTAVELKPDDYRKIKKILLGMDEPRNHEEVVALFAKIHRYLGFQSFEARARYPDGIGIDTEGKKKRIEFEFRSDSFRKDKGHDPSQCDVIICWKDDYVNPPRRLKVIALLPLYGSDPLAL